MSITCAVHFIDTILIRKEYANIRTCNETIAFRQTQAHKSILVQLKSIDDVSHLKNYCKEFGNISSIYHYSTLADDPNFVLIEFESVCSVEEIKRTSECRNSSEHIYMDTRVLWFQRKRNKNSQSHLSMLQESSGFPLHSMSIPTTKMIQKRLHPIRNVSEQMVELYNILRFTDIDVRLRFYTADQLQSCISKLFPTISIIPFGSSISGFGHTGCDLDLVCRNIHKNARINDSLNKLVFHAKYYSMNEKSHQQKLLSIVADIIQNFIPGIYNIERILGARVPIIKFVNKYTTMRCDLSNTNIVASHMTEVLFYYGEMDWRVKPLVCTIRKWARSVRITNEIPGVWLTNFSLTLLVIFYLQYKNVLPTINKLVASVGNQKFKVIHPQNLDLNRNKTTEAESLYSLLYGFFEFYVTFQFSTHGMCLREGRYKLKADNSAVYIFNPFEPSLNVSRNVNMNELHHMIKEFRTALLRLENEENGLEDLFNLPKASVLKSVIQNIDVKRDSSKTNTEKQFESTNEELLTNETNIGDANKLKGIIK
ncbi:poly(A) RNA polymerase, mitochondrial isoform X2 [Hylaeus volcanicus]|uniref:poly(A) RNA polymerase, mitochondrial isoform X2 n=1 Tax=Hylaeus volcanicus TaxID=313075 RepID=UPI0023B79A94|nr:poly(A) RNA polymerase, mitochondrial isoform X2 [Hylaeus volcanicus]